MQDALIHCYWEYAVVRLLMKTAWQVFKKLNSSCMTHNDIPKNHAREFTKTYIRTFTELFRITKKSKQPKCPSPNEQLNTCISIQRHIALKKKMNT